MIVMMISLLFHRYPSVPCQGCTMTNFRCLPAERESISLHYPTNLITPTLFDNMYGNDAVKKHSSADNTCRQTSIT